MRSYIRTIAKPGIKMVDLCETLEGSVRALIEENGLAAGIAFPTGCSLNHVAAHWTPNAGALLDADICPISHSGSLRRQLSTSCQIPQLVLMRLGRAYTYICRGGAEVQGLRVAMPPAAAG